MKSKEIGCIRLREGSVVFWQYQDFLENLRTKSDVYQTENGNLFHFIKVLGVAIQPFSSRRLLAKIASLLSVDIRSFSSKRSFTSFEAMGS